MMNEPKISIVTVCFNAEKYMESTILSVIGQSYKNMEFIVVDGESKDSTVDIINKYADHITNWVSEKDKGVYDAMNKGVAMATGDFINFMNAGDTFYDDDVLERFIPQIKPDTTIAYGQHFNAYRSFGYISPISCMNDRKLNHLVNVQHQAAFIKLSYHKQNLYDISLNIAADYNFFRNAYCRDKVEFQFIPSVVCNIIAYCGLSADRQNILELVKQRRIIEGRYSSRKDIINFNFFKIKHRISSCFYSLLPEDYFESRWKNRLKSEGYQIINN